MQAVTHSAFFAFGTIAFVSQLFAEQDINKILAIQQAQLQGFASNPWLDCGIITDFVNCELPRYPATHYEYAVAYNTTEPVPVLCSKWNYGYRIANKQPYLVDSDAPDKNPKLGGSMWYLDTLAADDAKAGGCPAGQWRQRYWYITNKDPEGSLLTYASNGCYSKDLKIYCKIRR